MKKILGINFGGLKEKTVRMVLSILLITIALFAAVSIYQSRMLTKIVGEAREEQQEKRLCLCRNRTAGSGTDLINVCAGTLEIIFLYGRHCFEADRTAWNLLLHADDDQLCCGYLS